MKLFERFLSLATALLALAGCSKADILNSFTPSEGYKIHRDVAYGTDARQTSDIYVPDTPDAAHTVVVFFYGGSWKAGDKDIYRFVGQALASKGYTTVIPNYPLYPKVYFPDFMYDGANALAWVHKNIGDYGADPEHMYVMGHSAGAHIAVLLSLDNEYLKSAGGSTHWLKGTIGLAGPYDFLPFTDPDVIGVFSKVRDADTQPINFVRKGVPPMLLVTGDADSEVGVKNTRNLAARLKEYHDSVETIEYPGVGHIGLVLAMSNLFRGKAPVLKDVDAYISEQNAKPH